MSELTEFILERVAKDEAVARGRRRLRPEFRGRNIEQSGIDPDWLTIDGEQVHLDDAMEPVPPEARVLAECEAKRRIVELHRGFLYSPSEVSREDYTVCAVCYGRDPDDWPCPTLRLLALPYAGHPDYREEWKP